MDDLSLMDDQNKKKKKAHKESYSDIEEIDQDCFHLIHVHVSCMVFDFSEETHKDNRAHEGLCS